MSLRAYSNRFLMLRNQMGMVVLCAFHSYWRLFTLHQIQLDAYCTVVSRRFIILCSQTNIYVWVCSCTSVFIYICICMHIGICIYIYIYICVCTYVFLYNYLCMRIYIYIYIYIPPISISLIFISWFFGVVPRAPTIIDITVTSMFVLFCLFFRLCRTRYLFSSFMFSLNITQWRMANWSQEFH